MAINSFKRAGLATTNTLQVYNPQLLGFTASGTYVIPTGLNKLDYVVVGGGAGGTSSGSTNDVTYNTGGVGGQVLTGTLTVVPGSTLTITIGAGGAVASNGGNTSLAGSGFTTVTANGSTTRNSAGGGGTFITAWGWFAGNGSGYTYVGSQPCHFSHGPGGGKGTGGNGIGNTAAPANMGGGGGGSAAGPSTGGSGFIGILLRAEI